MGSIQTLSLETHVEKHSNIRSEYLKLSTSERKPPRSTLMPGVNRVIVECILKAKKIVLTILRINNPIVVLAERIKTLRRSAL